MQEVCFGEMQHGHLEQVGYDTYCKLLDEVVKEIKGINTEEELDVLIDINISSYIPDTYIENNSQKIEVYQAIALCRTDADITKVMEDIQDRYGKIPEEVITLIEVAKIKQICKEQGIYKVMQKQNNIIIYFKQDLFTLDVVNLIKKYGERIKFSTGIMPYLTYKLQDKNKIIEEIEEFLNDNN